MGDHVRKRRLDLGLLQRDVALLLGVDVTTVNNWERGRTDPNLHVLPCVQGFLGYDPCPTSGGSLGARLRARRRAEGLSIQALARRLHVDPSTLRKWELGRSRPPARYVPRIETYVGDPVPADLNATAAERILAKRRSWEMTQRGFATLLNVSQQLLSAWERGLRSPGQDLVEKIDGLPLDRTTFTGKRQQRSRTRRASRN